MPARYGPINLSLLLLRFHVVSWIGVRCHPEQARRRGTAPLSAFIQSGRPYEAQHVHIHTFSRLARASWALAPTSDKCRILVQAATRPPTYVFFVNDAKLFNDDYRWGIAAAMHAAYPLPSSACCIV